MLWPASSTIGKISSRWWFRFGSGGARSSASTGLGACAFTHDRTSRVRRRDARTQRGAYARRFRRGTSAFRLRPGLCLQRKACAAGTGAGAGIRPQTSTEVVCVVSPCALVIPAGGRRRRVVVLSCSSTVAGSGRVARCAITAGLVARGSYRTCWTALPTKKRGTRRPPVPSMLRLGREA
jgi:hypothetical protein